MFFGQFEHSLDEKNRLLIPRKMRDELGNKIYILNGFDGCIAIYKPEGFIKMCNEIENLSFNHKSSRDYIRARLSSASEIDVDKLGRIQLPIGVINKYQLGKEIIVIGVIDHLEIWDKEKYLAYEKDINSSFENIAENLENLK